jgi:hypothetical protein
LFIIEQQWGFLNSLWFSIIILPFYFPLDAKYIHSFDMIKDLNYFQSEGIIDYSLWVPIVSNGDFLALLAAKDLNRLIILIFQARRRRWIEPPSYQELIHVHLIARCVSEFSLTITYLLDTETSERSRVFAVLSKVSSLDIGLMDKLNKKIAYIQ